MRRRSYLVFSFILMVTFLVAGVTSAKQADRNPLVDKKEILTRIINDTIKDAGLAGQNWEKEIWSTSADAALNVSEAWCVGLAIETSLFDDTVSGANETFHGIPARLETEYDDEYGNGLTYSLIRWIEQGWIFRASYLWHPNCPTNNVDHSGPVLAEYLYKYAHAYGLFDDAPAAPTQTPKPTTQPATCNQVNCSSRQSPVCSANLNYSLSNPGCEDGKCVYFDQEKCENGCDQNTGTCITSFDDPNDPAACEGVDCSYLPAYSCSETGDTSYFAPGCSAGRCGYFEFQSCEFGCDQDTGQCMEAEACEESCPDHCEGDTAFSAMGCEGGECEWIERECPFGCDANLPGMCVQPQGTVVLSASKDGYTPQQTSVENPDTAGSLTISGMVADQKSGAPVEGALVAVIEGAKAAETLTNENGYYELVALGNSADVMSNAEVNFALEPLTVRLEVVLEDVPMYPAGSSIVESTMRVAAAVYDPNGTLLKDRELTFAAYDPKNASWGSFSGVSDSNEHGYQVSTLTAGTFEFGTIVGSGKVPVRVLVTDTATGITGEAVIDVTQIEIAVDYYPVLATCSDCGPYPVTVTLKHPMGDDLSNVTISAGMDGGEGFLTTEMFGTSGSDELTVQTNANNQVTFYFKPQMGDLTREYNYSLYIMAEELGVVEAVPIRAEPLDIAISKLEPVAFSGNTGDKAYFNIGLTDLLHPNAPLDRLGTERKSPIKYQVTIRQTFPEVSSLASMAYGEQVQLVPDGQGGYRLKDSNSVPPTPYVTPQIDGATVYRVEVIAVDSMSGNPVYDSFISNNSNAVIIESGSPDGWFHTWMMNGVLTPNSQATALLKCAVSFVPIVGDAITAIDALNEAYQAGYKSQAAIENLSLKAAAQFAGEVGNAVTTAEKLTQLGLEAATAAGEVTTVEEMSKVANRLKLDKKALKVVGYLGSIYSCYNDFVSVTSQSNGTGMVIGPPVCCLDCVPMASEPLLELDEEDFWRINAMVIPFTQRVLQDMPGYYAVQLIASPDSNVVVMTQYGELPEFFAQNGVYFFLLPEGETYQIELTNSDVADMAVYDSDPQDSADILMHHVENLNLFNAVIEVSPQSNLNLAVDYDQDGNPDEILAGEIGSLDLTAPTILLTAPTTEVEGFAMLRAEFLDLGGSGIWWDSLQVWVDGVEVTEYANLSDVVMQLPVSGLAPGGHEVRIEVMDNAVQCG